MRLGPPLRVGPLNLGSSCGQFDGVAASFRIGDVFWISERGELWMF